jgi:starvation-inducible DNA-binding protein
MLVESKVRDSKVLAILQTHLADLHMIYSHLHNFHWNIEGAHFFEYHEHLQDMYEDVAEKIDQVAERILMLGERPTANLTEYTNISTLDALPSQAWGIPQIAEHVLADINHLIAELRRGITACEQPDDQGTMDFFIEMLRDYEKTRWFWAAITG